MSQATEKFELSVKNQECPVLRLENANRDLNSALQLIEALSLVSPEVHEALADIYEYKTLCNNAIHGTTLITDSYDAAGGRDYFPTNPSR